MKRDVNKSEGEEGFFFQNNMSIQLLNIDKIIEGIDRSYAPIISSINLLASVTSTSNHLSYDQLSTHKPFQFCIAEHQRAGRGQFGRPWRSPFGQNIYFSCGWIVNKEVNQLNGLSLVIGLACVDALKNYGFLSPIKLKWPNDLFHNGKKIGGILVETQTRNNHESCIHIGIGLNINSKYDEQNEITQPWTSLQLIDKKNHDRNIIISHLINSLIAHCQKFKEQGFLAFQKTWLSYDYFLGQDVVLTRGQEKKLGKALGVNELGNILLQDELGIVTPHSAGSISLT